MRFYMHNDCDQQPRTENSITKDYTNEDFVGRRHQQDQEYDIEDLRDRIQNKADLVFGQALNFLDYFHELGGFTAFLNLFRIGNARPSDEQIAADKSLAKYELIPLESLGDLTNAFLNCGALLKDEFTVNFVNEVEQIMKVRLLQMRD